MGSVKPTIIETDLFTCIEYDSNGSKNSVYEWKPEDGSERKNLAAYTTSKTSKDGHVSIYSSNSLREAIDNANAR